VRLNPETRDFQTFKVGMYPHDIVLDSAGNAWVNDYFAKQERIARVAARDGKVTVIPLPSAPRPASEGVPLSYGLQVDAKDRLWSTQLAANTLIRYDIATGESKLYPMPEANSGPRRTAVGPDGRIWIPEFNTGFLACFDPATERFERFDTGLGASGVYDVAVDMRSGDVWLGAALASELIRFDIRTKRFTHYPLPTEPAYMRHLAVDPANGDVWTAYSSLPTAVPKIARLSRRANIP
jgi:virginiamycin B lyase